MKKSIIKWLFIIILFIQDTSVATTITQLTNEVLNFLERRAYGLENF